MIESTPEEKAVIDFRKRKFVQVTRDIIDKDTQLTKPVDIVVYAVLCMYADNDTKSLYPSISKIAEKARCSERVVSRSIANLRDAGYIEVRERYDARGYQTSNQYVLLDVDLSDD